MPMQMIVAQLRVSSATKVECNKPNDDDSLDLCLFNSFSLCALATVSVSFACQVVYHAKIVYFANAFPILSRWASTSLFARTFTAVGSENSGIVVPIHQTRIVCVRAKMQRQSFDDFFQSLQSIVRHSRRTRNVCITHQLHFVCCALPFGYVNYEFHLSSVCER